MANIDILPYEGDYSEILEFIKLSAGIDSQEGVAQLLKIEQARGTKYFTARIDGKMAGMIGVYYDPTNAVTELEPPQIIDLAVLPDFRRLGVGRALMEYAVDLVRCAGYHILWLYADGNSTRSLSFYRSLRFRLVSVVPDYYGPGTTKAIFRRDF